MLLRKPSAIIIDHHHKGCEIYVVLHDYYNYHAYLISYKPLMHVVAYNDNNMKGIVQGKKIKLRIIKG